MLSFKTAVMLEVSVSSLRFRSNYDIPISESIDWLTDFTSVNHFWQMSIFWFQISLFAVLLIINFLIVDY